MQAEAENFGGVGSAKAFDGASSPAAGFDFFGHVRGGNYEKREAPARRSEGQSGRAVHDVPDGGGRAGSPVLGYAGDGDAAQVAGPDHRPDLAKKRGEAIPVDRGRGGFGVDLFRYGEREDEVLQREAV